jgi:endonuclease G
MWAAVNADYHPSKRRKKREEFGTDTWIPDPRIAGKYQIEDQELYEPAGKFDRGHIVRRDDTAWGDTANEEVFANSDSFHWTNCTPQHEQFNRAIYGFHGLWGELENHIQSQATNAGNKLSILAGPILDDANDIDFDFGGGPVKIPKRFWKVLCAAEKNGAGAAKLRTYGFILDQSPAIDKYGIERIDLGTFTTYQVPLKTIATNAGVTFAKVVMDADVLHDAPPSDDDGIVVESLDHVRL